MSAVGSHEDEPAQHPVQVPLHLDVAVRADHVLAERIERAVPAPEIEDVPHIDVLVHRVDAGGDAGHLPVAAQVAEARNRLAARNAGDGLEREATRDSRPPWIAAE